MNHGHKHVAPGVAGAGHRHGDQHNIQVNVQVIEQKNADLKAKIARRDEKIAHLQKELASRDEKIAHLQKEFASRDAVIRAVKQALNPPRHLIKHHSHSPPRGKH